MFTPAGKVQLEKTGVSIKTHCPRSLKSLVVSGEDVKTQGSIT